MKIYLAGPLFSAAEQLWLRETKGEIEGLARHLNREVEVIWPYELISEEELRAAGGQAKFEVFSRCLSHLKGADMLLALLDGSQVDDGTAWEIGYFYAIRPEGSPIIGIRTDFRNAGDTPSSKVNAMIEASCDRIVTSSQELYSIVSELLKP